MTTPLVFPEAWRSQNEQALLAAGEHPLSAREPEERAPAARGRHSSATATSTSLAREQPLSETTAADRRGGGAKGRRPHAPRPTLRL